MWRWTKSGYFIRPTSDGRGFTVKQGRSIVYEITSTLEADVIQHRVQAAPGASAPASLSGWDYNRATQHQTLVGPQAIPAEIIEAVNKNFPPRLEKLSRWHPVLEIADLVITMVAQSGRMLAHLLRVVIEALP